MGRTPRINAAAGRDHWPQVMSVAVAGGGVKGAASSAAPTATAPSRRTTRRSPRTCWRRSTATSASTSLARRSTTPAGRTRSCRAGRRLRSCFRIASVLPHFAFLNLHGVHRVLAGTTQFAQTQRATAAWGQGGHAPCRRRHFHEEPWYTTDVPFVVPALRTPQNTPLALQSPRVGEGAYDTLSAFEHVLRPMVSDETSLRRAKGQKNNTGPLASPTRVPLDPVGPHWATTNRPMKIRTAKRKVTE